MADLFEVAVDFILSVEGGLVDDPTDPGGLTKFGISQRAYPKLNIRDLTADTAKALYTEFLQKTNQAYLEVAQQHSNIRIIAPARVPKIPVSPSRLRTVLLGLVLGLAGGFAMAWILERFDDSIRNADDVNRLTHLPALAVIPAIGSNRSLLKGRNRKGIPPAQSTLDLPTKPTERMQRARVMEFDGRSPVSEAYRALRTALLFSAAGNPPKTILVTSVRMAEGKTTTATNTAIALAQPR